jgi:hypothetical protein
MRAGKSALHDGVSFEKLDLPAIRVAFGAVKTAAPEVLEARIMEADQTISRVGAE